MTMPVLPALKNQGQPGPLTDLLDELSEEQMVELYESAVGWANEGEPPITPDPDATVDTDLDSPADEPLPDDVPVDHERADEDEDLEAEAQETPEQQAQEVDAGTEDFDGLLEQVTAVSQDAEAIPDQFKQLLEEAKENEDDGGDPGAVESCMDEAQDYLDEIEDLQKEAEAARKDEDADGIAQAGLHMQEKLQIVKTLLTQAESHAATNKPAKPDKGAKGPDGEALPVDKTPALTLWANRYGKTG